MLVAQSVKIVPSNRLEEHNGKQYYIHIVEKGHTVYSIAKAYNVTIDEIYFENPSSKNGVNINQEILIPTVNKESEIRQEIKETEFEYFYHVCSENEDFRKVAEVYLQPELNIRNANPGARPPFREGQYLKIPVEIPDNVIKAEFPPEAQTRPNRNVYSNPTPKPKANTVSFNPDMPVMVDYRHIVIAGETTVGIAAKYGVAINDLKAVNPGLGDFVEKGERLRIPKGASLSDQKPVQYGKVDTSKPVVAEVKEEPIQPPKTTTETKQEEDSFVIHTVKKKETIYRISRDYGVPIQELYDANPGLTDKIKIGLQIKVPKKKISNSFLIHEVSGKLKTKKLAKLFGISEYELLQLNPRVDKYVYRGQEIKIPVGNKAIIVPIEDLEKVPDKPIDTKPNENNKPKDLSGPCIKNTSINNSEIKIALMVPLFLEDLQDQEIVDDVLRGNASGFQPFMFINFVEGAILAIDSLKSLGVNISLKIYDVDKTLTKTTKVLQDSELKDMDLIIGPFYNQSFKQVALFAGNFGIPIVNPLSFRKEILSEYKTAIKIKPSEESQIPIVDNLIYNYHPDSKVFFITQNSYRDADKTIEIENVLRQIVKPMAVHSNYDLYNYAILVAMRDEEWLDGDWMPNYNMEGRTLDPVSLRESLDDSTSFDNSLIRINYMPEGIEPFMKNASAFRENLVVLYGRDKSFVMDVMNKLNEFRDSLNISLIGMPQWERFENIDFTQMDNLNTITFESTFIDFDDYEVQDFIYKFRQEYSTDPGEYGFAGYDIAWFFGNAINDFGSGMRDCLPASNTEVYSGVMRFKKAFVDLDSYENYHWNIIQYEGFKKINLENVFSD